MSDLDFFYFMLENEPFLCYIFYLYLNPEVNKTKIINPNIGTLVLPFFLN